MSAFHFQQKTPPVVVEGGDLPLRPGKQDAKRQGHQQSLIAGPKRHCLVCLCERDSEALSNGADQLRGADQTMKLTL